MKHAYPVDSQRHTMIQEIHNSDGVRVFCGDARAVLATLDTDPARTVVITDPVWPNAPAGAFGVDDPTALFADVARAFPRLARRVVVQLGCCSDPRFLSGVPPEMRFLRVCWLRYAVPSYLGTVLGSGDVAYVYGSREAPPGKKVIDGECTDHSNRGREVSWHPMPRKLGHVRWLVSRFTRPGDTVIDPFAGSGTTLLAARDAGRRVVGIEQNPDFAARIVGRLTEQLRLLESEPA